MFNNTFAQSANVTQLTYFAGLQLELGGFGGINYTLHAGNPAARPMEPGITKAGLTWPKLSQPHTLAFAKVSYLNVWLRVSKYDTHIARKFYIFLITICVILFLDRFEYFRVCLVMRPLVTSIYFSFFFSSSLSYSSYVFETFLRILFSLLFYFLILLYYIFSFASMTWY